MCVFCNGFFHASTLDSFPDIQMSNITRPQSPVLTEGHIPKLSSSPPKPASGWHSLNPVHKKGIFVSSELVTSRVWVVLCSLFCFFCYISLLFTAVTTFSPPKNKHQKKYRSVVSDVFDGTIVSSVQCLTCDRVSVYTSLNGWQKWCQK